MDPMTICFILGLAAGIILTAIFYEYRLLKIERECDQLTAEKRKLTKSTN